MRLLPVVLLMASFAGIAGASAEVVVENGSFRLVVGGDARAKSLVVKATGEECLSFAEPTALFAVTQDRPFNNELKLIEPTRETTWQADSLRREGDLLVAGFPHRQYEAVVRTRAGAGYLAFELVDFRCERKTTYDYLQMDIPPVASFRVLQLPVADRAHFGAWLNAAWDARAAVGVVATCVETDAGHTARPRFRTLWADLVAGRRLRGGGAALVVAAGREPFLDAMDALERDFGLPRGVESRRGWAVNEPIFHLSDGFSPETLDETIAYAKRGGFRLVTFNMGDVTEEIGSWGRFGDYDLRRDFYPDDTNGLKKLLARVKAAGLHPGLHTLHSHIGLRSRYVTPVADPRLNKTRRYTLAEPLPATTNALASLRVFETTADAPRFAPCRILQFGGELFSYEDYSREPPWRFFGVRRGAHATRAAAHPRGEIGGILDVSEFGAPLSCYVDERTDLQDEIAEKLAALYACGFEYVYLDGSEGVNRPFNFEVANGQYRVWRRLSPEPLFGEGAAKTHFGWHMLAGANAFDVFRPEIFKEKLREFPCRQAPQTWEDLTRVDFGWWQFYAPKKDGKRPTVGTQPDMWEYGVSRAAAWDGAASILMPLPALRAHPRADNVLETLRRWNDARRRGFVTDAWRARLRDLSREHHLYRNGRGDYELCEIEMLPTPAAATDLRGFLFERGGRRVVACWHTAGSGTVEWALGPKRTVSNLAYVETDLSRDAVKAAWRSARLR